MSIHTNHFLVSDRQHQLRTEARDERLARVARGAARSHVDAEPRRRAWHLDRATRPVVALLASIIR